MVADEPIGIAGPDKSDRDGSGPDDEASGDSDSESSCSSPDTDPPLEPATLGYVVFETSMLGVLGVCAGGVVWAFIEYAVGAGDPDAAALVPPLLGSLTTIGFLCVMCLLSQSKHTKPTALVSLARWGICAIVCLITCIGLFSCSSAIQQATHPDADVSSR